MADFSRFDDVFLSLASQSDGIEGMLRIVFDFLHRRTDFYVVKEARDLSARMGFNDGEAERVSKVRPGRDIVDTNLIAWADTAAFS
mmetsp:Transcript_13188/g.48933  ORF Transcript_13188/g.48933 Transcript_13188/m.48933 type:complete len:86 (+) Transcript_13188:98-355(+)